MAFILQNFRMKRYSHALELWVGIVVSLPNPLAHERALALSEAENLSTPLRRQFALHRQREASLRELQLV